MVRRLTEPGYSVVAFPSANRPTAASGKASQALAAPDCADEVASVLGDYVAQRYHCALPQYAQRPVEMSGGWETFTYAFQFHPQPALPQPLTQPLVLRIYSCCAGLDRARHELAVQGYLQSLHYPVPGVVLLEEDADYFGGPFLLSPQIVGRTLLQSTLGRIWMLPINAARMANLHARLHNLPTRDFPRPRGAFLTRTLEEMSAIISRYELHGLQPGFDWLRTHRPPPGRPSILHLDFHPLNILKDNAGHAIVIDWTEADVGDAHADLGNTLVCLECLGPDRLNWFDRYCVGVFRRLFVNLYLTFYRRQRQLEDRLLTYYRALAALRRLCQYGQWLGVGPTINGRKPSAIEHLRPEHFRIIEAYFHKWTQVPVVLESPPFPALL
jgi:aminoglycoside phosphotransferase (APT) family kinase protein